MQCWVDISIGVGIVVNINVILGSQVWYFAVYLDYTSLKQYHDLSELYDSMGYGKISLLQHVIGKNTHFQLQI